MRKNNSTTGDLAHPINSEEEILGGSTNPEEKQPNFLNPDEESESDDLALGDTDIEVEPKYESARESAITKMDALRKRNWFVRNFRPVSNGGIRSSAFTLITGTVGAGVLSLPTIAAYFGLITSLILVVVFGILTIWSYYI